MISRVFLRISCAGALALAAGCVKQYTYPGPGSTLELGGLKAEFHAFGDKLCDTDPRIVANELRAMNEVLLKYVDGTSAGIGGVWAEEHARLLDEGARLLPTALDAHEATVRGIAACKPDPKLGIDELTRQGEELAKMARARLAETPEVLPYAQASAALGKWKATQPGVQAQAKQDWCPANVRRGSADIYYVATDEHGTTTFFFCDGSKVTRAEGGDPEYVAPDSRRISSRAYLREVASYPESEIRRAPRLPVTAKPAAQSSEDEGEDPVFRDDGRAKAFD